MAIPLLRKEIEVFGLDNSQEMLDLYKANLVKYNMESNMLLGDLKDFKTDEKFDSNNYAK